MSIKCGNCKDMHDTAADVRTCYYVGRTIGAEDRLIQNTAEPFADESAEAVAFLGLSSGPRGPRPSEKALNFAHRMLRERVPYGVVADAEETSGIEAAHEVLNGMDAKNIGIFLDNIKGCPLRPSQTRTSAVQVGEGMYRKDGVIYKVQKAIHGSGHLYVKRLTETGFEYAAGALGALREEHKMTLEECKEYGALYGTCCVCGRTLTDENSIAAGIGPVCAGKRGWFA